MPALRSALVCACERPTPDRPDLLSLRPGATSPMRQFSTILVVIYLVLGIGTGVAYYAEGEKDTRPESGRDELAVAAARAGLLWPFHILDILAGHDPR